MRSLSQQDPVLSDLTSRGDFTRDEFISAYKRYKTLNMLDPIWSFIIDEEIKKYISSGAFVQLGYNTYGVTDRAKACVG